MQFVFIVVKGPLPHATANSLHSSTALPVLSKLLLYFRKQEQKLKGYNPHSSLYGVHEKQTSWSIDLLVLLLDVARYLLQHLEENMHVYLEGTAWWLSG